METFRIKSGRLQADIAPLGGRLHAIRFDGSANLVQSAADTTQARGAHKYHGATVGPVANRIAGGSATLDGRICTFDRNERGVTTLHGGETGLHGQTWYVSQQSDTALSLELDLPDGTGGFPGNRSFQVAFGVADDTLTVRYSATSDAPTWINLALHPYWTLGVSRDELTLMVSADRYTPVDELQIPTGDLAPVEGTVFDLRREARPSTEIDHNFVLSGQAPAVILSSPSVKLEVETDAPGAQIFTGKPFGIAIEPQHFPDAMHHAAFPSIELKPGETYLQNSSYRFATL